MTDTTVSADQENKNTRLLAILALVISIVAVGFSIWSLRKAQGYIYTERSGVEPTVIPEHNSQDNLMQGTGQPPTQ